MTSQVTEVEEVGEDGESDFVAGWFNDDIGFVRSGTTFTRSLLTLPHWCPKDESKSLKNLSVSRSLWREKRS
ncbi:unnamed protein product [Linum trigynum]|uniref:Uncharacterized protein n=1 Tax=Linum trigynum TaxID=586398 RepID=A0AAV2FET2_9ROSI